MAGGFRPASSMCFRFCGRRVLELSRKAACERCKGLIVVTHGHCILATFGRTLERRMASGVRGLTAFNERGQ